LTELSQQTACPTAFSNNNAIIRSERLPPFGDQTRQLLQQRLDEIDDSLRDVNAERKRLKNFSIP